MAVWIRELRKKKLEIERLDICDDVFGLDQEEVEKRAILLGELLQETSWRDAQLFQKSRVK